MSETVEERIRRVAKEDHDLGIANVYASDLVELFDKRDKRIAELEAAAVAMDKAISRAVGQLDRRYLALSTSLYYEYQKKYNLAE